MREQSGEDSDSTDSDLDDIDDIEDSVSVTGQSGDELSGLYNSPRMKVKSSAENSNKECDLSLVDIDIEVVKSLLIAKSSTVGCNVTVANLKDSNLNVKLTLANHMQKALQGLPSNYRDRSMYRN